MVCTDLLRQIPQTFAGDSAYITKRPKRATWLINPLNGNSLDVYYHFPTHLLMFCLMFSQFLRAFFMFPLIFLPVSFLSLRHDWNVVPTTQLMWARLTNVGTWIVGIWPSVIPTMVADGSNPHHRWPRVIIIITAAKIITIISKILNSVMLIKFDEKEYWCELLNASNISYKPWANLTWTSSATPVVWSFF